eukprot:EG_transcript_33541
MPHSSTCVPATHHNPPPPSALSGQLSPPHATGVVTLRACFAPLFHPTRRPHWIMPFSFRTGQIESLVIFLDEYPAKSHTLSPVHLPIPPAHGSLLTSQRHAWDVSRCHVCHT